MLVTTFDQLRDALDGDGRIVTHRGNHIMARCPLTGHAGDDQHPGLSITDMDGMALVFCHGLHERCYGELLDHYGMERGKPRPPERLELLEVYDYQDETGDVVYRVNRYWDNDTNTKTFRPERPSPDGAMPDLDSVTRVPYNLPEILEATEGNKPIVLVEGEKDANALIAHGIPATTTAGGKGSWGAGDYAKWFKDATVVIVPDRDGVGYAIDAAKDLRRIAKVHIAKLPDDIGEKGDSYDFIVKHGLEAYGALLNEAPEYSPEMARIPDEDTEAGEVARQANPTVDEDSLQIEWMEEQIRIKFSQFLYAGNKATAMIDVWYSTKGHIINSTRVDLYSGTQKDRINTTITRGNRSLSLHPYIEYAFGKAIQYIDSPKQAVSVLDIPPVDLMHYEWLIEGFLPGGKGEEGANLLVADGETGKTWLAMGSAISIASGKQVFGRLNVRVKGKVLYLDWEGSPKKFRRRFGRIIAGARITEPDVGDNLHYIREWSPFTSIVARIRKLVREEGITLIVIDSLRGAAKGTLKDDDTAEMFFNAVNSLGIPVFIIHHTNREDTFYGSAFIRNFARFMWVVPEFSNLKNGDEKMLLMKCDKDNEGKMSGTMMGMKIEWADPDVYMTPYGGKFAEMVVKNPNRTPPLTDTLLELLEGEQRWMTLDALIASVNPEGAADPKDYRKRASDALNKMVRKGVIQVGGERKNKKYAARGIRGDDAPWE